MSNSLAVAAVTTAVRYLLERALQQPHAGPVGGATTTVRHPGRFGVREDDDHDTPCLNLFLYRVTPNHTIKLNDLPTRSSDGRLARRPFAALDLHYLITGHGQDGSLDAQRLLGRAALALAETPVLTRDVVTRAVTAYATMPETTFLAEADLADQVELVRITPESLSLEELSKLWSVLLQTPYRLCLTYTASVAVLEADVTPRAVLPVRTRRLTITAAGPPRLASLLTEPPGEVVVAGTPVTLTGSDLAGPVTLVRIGTTDLVPSEPPTPQEVSVTVDDTVPAGLHPVRMIHQSGTPVRVVAQSNALPLLVRPVISVQAVSADDVTLAVRPSLAAGQRATVTLQTPPGEPGPARTVTVDLAPLPPGSPPRPTVTLPRAGIPDGTWLLRLRVDGVDSLPELVGDLYGAPTLTLT